MLQPSVSILSIYGISLSAHVPDIPTYIFGTICSYWDFSIIYFTHNTYANQKLDLILNQNKTKVIK